MHWIGVPVVTPSNTPEQDSALVRFVGAA